MAIAYTGHCPKHGQQPFLNDICRACSAERDQAESDRWKSLSVEEKLDELKERLDRQDLASTKLGGI